MLKLNPRGQLPVLKDEPRLFGRTPEEAGTIMRVICEFQNNAEPQVRKISAAVFDGALAKRMDEITAAVHAVGNEARVIEARLSHCDYPALARWVTRVEALPGYERTYPPHWREHDRT